jgi:hypothetical protein
MFSASTPYLFMKSFLPRIKLIGKAQFYGIWQKIPEGTGQRPDYPARKSVFL